MTDYHTDSTVVHRIISVHIEERSLQNSGRETDFVGCRVIISIHRLRCHQPFVLVNRFACFSNHIIEIPLAGTVDIGPIRIIFDFQSRVIFPFIRITDLYMEGSQFLQRFHLCRFAHPFQCFNTLTQRALQVLHQCNHTFFGSGREIFLYIHLSYDFAQRAVYGTYRAFPTRLHFFLAGHGSAIEVKVLCYKIIAQERGCCIDQIPLKIELLIFKRYCVYDIGHFLHGCRLTDIHFFQVFQPGSSEVNIPVESREVLFQRFHIHLIIVGMRVTQLYL